MTKYNAIIIARAGSKRIKNKNFINFCGKPMYHWTIENIIKSKLFHKIYFSSDKRNLNLSKYKNVEYIQRSGKNSLSNATTYDATLEFLNKYKTITQKYILIAYGCAPLINFKDLKKGLDKIKSKNYDTVFPISKIDTPLEKNLIKFGNNIRPLFKKKFYKNSQNLRSVYRDAGQWYWINISKFLKKKKVITNNSGYLELSDMRVQDINYPEDLRLAKLKFNENRNSNFSRR